MPVSLADPFPILQDGGYVAQLPAPYIRGGGVKSAPFLLSSLGQVVKTGLGFCGLFCQQGGVVVCRLLDDAPEEPRVRFRLVRRSTRRRSASVWKGCVVLVETRTWSI